MEELNEQEIKKIEEHYEKLLKIDNPIERMDYQIEYMKTHPLTNDAIIFLYLEMKLMWGLQKSVYEKMDETGEISKPSG